jgi:hypothetical protein
MKITYFLDVKQVALIILRIAAGVLLFCSNAVSQIKSGEFLIGGTNQDQGSSIIQTKDGGYAIVGYTTSFGKNPDNIYVIKLDSNANLQWTKVISDTNNYTDSYATSVCNTSDGSIVLVGYQSGSATDRGFYVVKLDYSGNILWEKIYGNVNYWTIPSRIIETSDKGFAITGQNINGTSNSYVFIVKLDQNGGIQWSSNITTSSKFKDNDVGGAIIQTYDGGYAIAGVHGTYPIGSDIFVLRTDASGKVLWNRTTKGGITGGANSIVQTNDSGLVVMGAMGSDSGASIFKLNKSGNVIWSEVINNGFDGNSLIKTGDNGYAISGYGDNQEGRAAMGFIKADSNGHVQWTRSVGGGSIWPNKAYIISAGSVIQTNDMGFAFTGLADSMPSGTKYSVLFLKLDSSGNVCTYDSLMFNYRNSNTLYSCYDTVFAFGLSSYGSEYILSSGGTETSVCYPYIVGIQSINPPLKGISIFPNPNNGLFQLIISNEQLGIKNSVEVYNMLGQEIYSQFFIPNSPFSIDLQDSPSGVYLYRVISEDGAIISSGKFIIQ